VRRIKVGTRKSRLATIQTRIVTDMLQSKFPDLELEPVAMTTTGDRLAPERRGEVEGKAAFTEDIETALAKKKVDIAVHSMKDLPVKIRSGLVIGAIPQRADPRDVFVSKSSTTEISQLRTGAVIGTSSIRRKAQLLAMRSDISVVDLHGNVDTRLSKMDRLGIDGIVIAAAGLERLGETGRISHYFSIDEMMPAPGQGAIAVEMREGDADVGTLLAGIDDPKIRAATESERSFAASLGSDCDVPAGALARLSGRRISLKAAIIEPDGSKVVKAAMTGDVTGAVDLGTRLARQLLEDGGTDILSRVRR